MNFQRILRRLILCEVVMTGLAVLAAFLEEPHLPAELRQYLESPTASSRPIPDPAYLAILMAILLLVIVSWVALWRGWRSGRRLYTAVWICSLPGYAIAGPSVTGALGSLAEGLAMLTAGAILSLLYFSEIRVRYEAAKVV